MGLEPRARRTFPHTPPRLGWVRPHASCGRFDPLPRFENHYGVAIGKKKGRGISEADEAILNKQRSNHLKRKVEARKAGAKIDPKLDEQFSTGHLLGTAAERASFTALRTLFGRSV